MRATLAWRAAVRPWWKCRKNLASPPLISVCQIGDIRIVLFSLIPNADMAIRENSSVEHDFSGAIAGQENDSRAEQRLDQA